MLAEKKLFVLLPNLNKGGAETIVITLLINFNRSFFDITLVVLDSGMEASKSASLKTLMSAF